MQVIKRELSPLNWICWKALRDPSCLPLLLRNKQTNKQQQTSWVFLQTALSLTRHFYLLCPDGCEAILPMVPDEMPRAHRRECVEVDGQLVVLISLGLLSFIPVRKLQSTFFSISYSLPFFFFTPKCLCFYCYVHVGFPCYVHIGCSSHLVTELWFKHPLMVTLTSGQLQAEIRVDFSQFPLCIQSWQFCFVRD